MQFKKKILFENQHKIMHKTLTTLETRNLHYICFYLINYVRKKVLFTKQFYVFMLRTYLWLIGSSYRQRELEIINADTLSSRLQNEE